MKKIELEEARSGADLILDTLLELGISTIFGYPGGAVLPLYDAIYIAVNVNHVQKLILKKAERLLDESVRTGIVEYHFSVDGIEIISQLMISKNY